jgi:hypothetical protein
MCFIRAIGLDHAARALTRLPDLVMADDLGKSVDECRRLAAE